MSSVIIIGYIWPERHSSAAGLRSWNLIEIFQEAGYLVHCLSAAKENHHTQALRKQGIRTHSIALNRDSFNTLLQNLSPSIVIFDRFITEEQFGWRVEQVVPQAIRILDTQDLHFLRKARQEQVEKKLPFNLQREDTFRELASIYRSDATLIVSSYEQQLLINEFHIPPGLLTLLPLSYPRPINNGPSFSERCHFVFIGNFRHSPNHDSVLYTQKNIWPLIQKHLPRAEWHIYGAYPTKEIASCHDPKKGIYVKGPVRDHLSALSQYRVNLAPLRFGAGIKGKILDGWFSGTPCVVTPIGAEGMGTPWGGTIASLGESFVQRAVSLYKDKGLWEEAQAQGFERVREAFSHDRNKKITISLVTELKEKMEEKRRQNIVGTILRQEQFRSTKYFSRWIQEKEKNLRANS